MAISRVPGFCEWESWQTMLVDYSYFWVSPSRCHMDSLKLVSSYEFMLLIFLKCRYICLYLIPTQERELKMRMLEEEVIVIMMIE